MVRMKDLRLKKLLESERQRLSRHVYDPRYVCSWRIGPPAWYPRTDNLIVWEALDIAIRAIAFGGRSTRPRRGGAHLL